MFPTEFRAVVMAAGEGNRMIDLTSCHPKCLLPVGPYPLIWYPLYLLQQEGFKEVIVTTQHAAVEEVALIPQKYGLKLSLDIVPIYAKDNWGTADTLRHLSDRIDAQTDLIVISGDLVANFRFCHVAEFRRLYDATLTVQYAKAYPDLSGVAIPGPPTRMQKEREFVAIDSKTSRLASIITAEKQEEEEEVSCPGLRRFSNVSLTNKLCDMHVYVIKRWVLNYLTAARDISTLKMELLPLLVNKQFGDSSSEKQKRKKHNIFEYVTEDSVTKQMRDMGIHDDEIYDSPFRCYAHVMENGFAMRINTIQAYIKINRMIYEQWGNIVPNVTLTPIHSSAQVLTKQIGPECFVGEGTVISDKTSLQHCVIGANCNIEQKTKLTNCILMDSVTIKEGSDLSGCVICRKAIVGTNCQLQDVIVNNDFTVPNNTTRNKEVLGEEDSFDED